MKILWLTNLPAPYKLDFFNALGETAELTVLFERNGATNRTWQKEDGEKFNAVFLKGVKIGEENSFCPSVKKHLKGSYDKIVIGGYGTFTAMYAIRTLKKLKKEYCLWVDGGIVREESQKKYNLKKKIISGAKTYFCPGEQTAKFLSHYGVDKKEIVFYPFTSINEKDIELPTKEKKLALREKLEIAEEKVVLSVGQFIKRKGLDLLIRASKNLDKSYGVYIIGDNPTEEYLDLKNQLGLDNLHFLPFMDKEHINEYYALADIFVLPTREDIWGLVVNEAMSKGLGVITTKNCVAGLELVKDNGYLIDVESVEQISNEIYKAEEFGFEKLGENSIELIKNYTIEEMAKTVFADLEK